MTTPPYFPAAAAATANSPLSKLTTGRQKALLYQQQLASQKMSTMSSPPSSCPSPRGVTPSVSVSRSSSVASPTTRPVSTTTQQYFSPAAGTFASSKCKKPVPPSRRRIFYTSRTHSHNLSRLLKSFKTVHLSIIKN